MLQILINYAELFARFHVALSPFPRVTDSYLNRYYGWIMVEPGGGNKLRGIVLICHPLVHDVQQQPTDVSYHWEVCHLHHPPLLT